MDEKRYIIVSRTDEQANNAFNSFIFRKDIFSKIARAHAKEKSVQLYDGRTFSLVSEMSYYYNCLDCLRANMYTDEAFETDFLNDEDTIDE